jgi:hypothetical protein
MRAGAGQRPSAGQAVLLRALKRGNSFLYESVNQNTIPRTG